MRCSTIKLVKAGAAIQVFLAIAFTPLGGAFAAQGLSDLLGKKPSGIQPPGATDAQLKFGRDRVDLGLAPGLGAISPAEKKYVGFSAQADLRMICGQYDLKASLKHLLGREARQEFLDGILGSLVQEVVGSGMELLCQAEPTLCTLLQNYSVSANLKMGYYKDICTAIESAVVDAQKKNYANAVDQCLKEKKDQGVSLDRAVELCQGRSTPIRGFHGEILGELDLGKELPGLFQNMGLTPGAQKLAQRLADETKVGPSTVATQADANALSRLYDEMREDYAKRLSDLVDQAKGRTPIPTVDLRAAVPEGAPPLAEDEIRSYALLPDTERSAVVATLSSALALFEMGRQIREVERAIEALQGAPTIDEAKRKMLDDRLVRLRNEKGRLLEFYREQALVLEAIKSAKSLAGREYAKRVAEVQVQAGDARRKTELLADVAAVGSLPPAGSPGRSGGALLGPSSCANCGLQASFGSYGEDR
jgi:hypothetical protein